MFHVELLLILCCLNSLKNKSSYLSVKDHSVTGETFQLLYNKELEMLETFPQPTPEELPRYYQSEDYISHTDSKRNFFERIYHFVKEISLRQKLKLIESIHPEKRNLLDVGCGTGDFLRIAQQHNWTVSGIEPNERARDIANAKTDNRVNDVIHGPKFRNPSFDVITLWHVLEHLPDLHEQLKLYKELLTANGTLIVAVPNYKSYDAQKYKGFWAGYDVPRHLWHFSQKSISQLAHSHQMQLVKVIPMKFDSFYVSLLSEKYKTGKMNPIKGFWTGLLSNFKARKSGEYSSLIYIIQKQKTKF